MTGLSRRELLLLGGTMLMTQVPAAARTDSRTLSPPPLPDRLPEAWLRGPTLAIWPGSPPGASTYKPQELPEHWQPVFLRNIATPQLHIFRPARPNGRALLVIPGGSYQFVSIANEGVDVAERLIAEGVTVFVLVYRLPGEGWASRSDVPLQDAQRALRVIRSQAAHFGIDADRIGVLGFSAGGHLAATLATEHSYRAYARVDAIDDLSALPFCVALVYPVVTMISPWTHALSRDLLLGESPSAAQIDRRSAELHVDASTPPTFLIHALDDSAVPVENSLRLLAALREAKRPIEAHLLQEGGHAFGVGYPQTPSAQWIGLFDTWWSRLVSIA